VGGAIQRYVGSKGESAKIKEEWERLGVGGLVFCHAEKVPQPSLNGLTRAFVGALDWCYCLAFSGALHICRA